MKRSRNLRLTIMVAAIPVALTACESTEPTGQIVASVSECHEIADVSPSECRAQYRKALATHREVAPRFESASDCSAQFGACTVVQSEGRTSYIPPMTGFLLGYASSELLNNASRNRNSSAAKRDHCNRYPDSQDCYRDTRGYYRITYSTPLYRDYNTGNYRRPTGEEVRARSNSGRVWDSAATKPPPTRAIAVSRSGFGSASAGRSKFRGRSSFGG